MDKKIAIGIILVMLFLLYKNIDNYVNITERFNPNYIRSPYNPNNIAVLVDDKPTMIDNYFGMYKNIYEYVSDKKLPENKKYIPDTTQKDATYIESYNRFYKNVKNTFNELFSAQCNYLYNFSTAPSTSGNGNMYLKDKVLIINTTDYNKIDGINTKLYNTKPIIISNGEKTDTYKITDYNIDTNKNINVTLESPVSFDINRMYTLYPCSSGSSGSDSAGGSIISSGYIESNKLAYDIIVENNINNSFYVFIIVIVLILIMINSKVIFNYLSKFFSSSKSDKVNKDLYSGGKKYYIGGYDYRDYSE